MSTAMDIFAREKTAGIGGKKSWTVRGGLSKGIDSLTRSGHSRVSRETHRPMLDALDAAATRERRIAKVTAGRASQSARAAGWRNAAKAGVAGLAIGAASVAYAKRKKEPDTSVPELGSY